MVCSTKCESCCVNVHSTSTILVPSSLESHFEALLAPSAMSLHFRFTSLFNLSERDGEQSIYGGIASTGHQQHYILPTHPLHIAHHHQHYPLHPINIFSAIPHSFLFISTPNSIELTLSHIHTLYKFSTSYDSNTGQQHFGTSHLWEKIGSTLPLASLSTPGICLMLERK